MTPEQDGGKGFSHNRGRTSTHKSGPADPTCPDDAFWFRDPDTHKPKLQLSVSQQIEDLENVHCKSKTAFTRIVQLTNKLSNIDSVKRRRAKEAFKQLERVYKDACEALAADPDCCSNRHIWNPLTCFLLLMLSISTQCLNGLNQEALRVDR